MSIYINANINNFFYASFPYALLGHFLLDKLYHILNTYSLDFQYALTQCGFWCWRIC